MRVLFLSPSNRLLGARRSLIDLISHLPGEVEPLVVCPGVGDLHTTLTDCGVPVEAVAHYPWRKFLGQVRSRTLQLPRLRSIARRFRPDVIHVNEYHAIPQGLRVVPGALHQAKAGFPLGQQPPVIGHVRSFLEPRHIRNYELRHCARVACVSEYLKSLFPPEYSARLRVVYNGVDLTGFRRREGARRPLPQTAHWPESALVCGLLALVSDNKNQLIACEAVARAAAQGADVRLVIAGDAFKSSLEYGERLTERLRAPDLAQRVVWLPFQKDVQAIYDALDVNLLISTQEGFGRTIIEAGSVGLPSIGSQTGGIPEIIMPGETGWLTPVGDAQAVAAAMVEAWSRRIDTHRRGHAAHERIRANFTLEATARRVVDLWTEALEESPVRP